MSKLSVILCVAIFVSAGNAFSLPIKPGDIQHYVQQITNDGITKLLREYEKSLYKVASESVDLSTRSVKFAATVTENLAIIAENLSNSLKVEVGKAEEANVNVDECSPPEDTNTLGELAKVVANTTKGCINKFVDSGLERLEEIRKTSQNVIDNLDKVVEDSKLCSNGEKSGLAAITCSSSSMATALYHAVTPATGLVNAWSLYKVISLSLETRLYTCTYSDRVALNQEVSRIRLRTEQCIQKKIEEALAATTESH